MTAQHREAKREGLTAVFVRGQGEESSTPWVEAITEQWNNVIIISTHFNH